MSYASAYGHAVATCPSFSIVRLDSVQFSRYNTTAGESITITGELKSLVNRESDVTFVPLVDRDKVVAIVGKQQCGPARSQFIHELRGSVRVGECKCIIFYRPRGTNQHASGRDCLVHTRDQKH